MGGDARPVRLLGGGCAVAARRWRREEGRRAKGREKKSMGVRLKRKSLKYIPKRGSSARELAPGIRRESGSTRIDNILSLNFRSRIEQSQS